MQRLAALGPLALAIVALAGPAYRVGLPLSASFACLRYGAYLGLAGLVVGGMLTAGRLARRARGAALRSALAAGAGLFAVAMPYLWQAQAQQVPPIHDISTDLENPPTFDTIARLRHSAPNGLDRDATLVAQQRAGYPDLAPLTLPEPVNVVLTRATTVAGDLGWTIVSSDERAGRLEATDTTRWFGFTDDVVVRLTPWGAGTRVDVRSVSRVGRSDLGTNARRIRAFLDALQQD